MPIVIAWSVYLISEGNTMITSKVEAKEKITKYKQLFELIIGKPCTLSFDMHRVEDVVITGIELGKTTGLKNAPEKRVLDGKNKSPMIFHVITNQGDLTFALDDTIITALSNGIRLTVPLAKPLSDTRKDIVVDLRIQ